MMLANMAGLHLEGMRREKAIIHTRAARTTQ